MPTTDDEMLPELPPLEPDGGGVDVPEESLRDFDDAGGDDDELGPAELRVLVVRALPEGDDAPGGDEGSDEAVEALPDDGRGSWRGSGDERPPEDVAELDDPPVDVPDAGEEGPERDPWDDDDTALPPLADESDDD